MLPMPIISNLNINPPIVYEYFQYFDVDTQDPAFTGSSSGTYTNNNTDVYNISAWSYPTNMIFPDGNVNEVRIRWVSQSRNYANMVYIFERLTDGTDVPVISWYNNTDQITVYNAEGGYSEPIMSLISR